MMTKDLLTREIIITTEMYRGTNYCAICDKSIKIMGRGAT